MSNADQLFRSLGLPAELAETAGDAAEIPPSEQAAGALRETSGPTTLSIGDLVDGEFLKRDGNEIVSAEASAGATQGGYQFFNSNGTVDLTKTHTDVALPASVVLALPNGTVDGQVHTFRTIAGSAEDTLQVNCVVISGNTGGTTDGKVGAYVRIADTEGPASALLRWNVGVPSRGDGWVVESLGGDVATVFAGDDPE